MRILFLVTFFLLKNLVLAQDSLKVIQLEEVAVTIERGNKKSPVPRVILSRRQMRQIDIGQNPVITLEKLTPSIISFSDAGTSFGNYNQIRLRGIDQSRINVTLNGVPLNDMVDQTTYFSNFADFTSSMQSVQVQRGVGIISNGTASYAGSINYESVNLSTQKAFGSVSLSGGSFNSFRVNAEGATGRTNSNFSAYTRVSRIVSNGYKNHSGTNAHSMFFSGVRFFEKSLLKITALAGKTQNDLSYLPVTLPDINKNPRTNYFDEDDTDDFEQEVLQIQHISFLNNNLSLNHSVYYNGSRGFFPFTFGDQYIYTITNNHYGMFSNLSYQKKNIVLIGGIHAYVVDRENEEAIAPNISESDYMDATRKSEISIFTKTEYTLNNNLTIFLDLQLRAVNSRYTSDSLTFYTDNNKAERKDIFFNPKIGINYQISSTSSTYAFFGRTGREPTRADLLIDPNNFSYIYSGNYQSFINPDIIKSEYVNDLELGYQFSGKNLQIDINGFFMNFEDEISAIGGLSRNSYFPIRKNVKSSMRYGLELFLEYKVFKTLSLGLISTYMTTNVTKFNSGGETHINVKHAYTPDLQIHSSITWAPISNITLGFDTRYVSQSFLELSNNPSLILPSFFVANANIQWNVTNNIGLALWVNNLFNERYYTDGAPLIDGNPGYRIQSPRNFFTSLKVKF